MKRVRAALLALFTLVALGAGVAWWRLRPPPLPPAPTSARLASLRADRDALQVRFREAVLAQGERSVEHAPRAGVMIGIPTRFTASILDQIVTGLFGETTLTLRNLKVHKDGAVKAKILFTKRTLGQYVLDVQIHEVQGVLKPGRPALVFGRNAVGFTLPVHLAEGQGQADLHLKWDSKGVLPNVVCGDIDITRGVTGTVVPQDYVVKGGFAISSEGTTIVLRPHFPDLAVRVFPDPSEQAWGVVDGVIKDRPKGCEIALTKVDIKEKLGGLVGRGFNVKVPQKIFKPVRLPAGVRQSLEIQGMQLALEVTPTGVLVAHDRIWYGADLNFRAKGQRQR